MTQCDCFPVQVTTVDEGYVWWWTDHDGKTHTGRCAHPTRSKALAAGERFKAMHRPGPLPHDGQVSGA